jgi:NAD(P)-dependent dehydrogenase (short-subunit alcohol dehydrogenase family)
LPEAEGSERKWALVLGASSGFGAASSLALAQEGYHIFAVHLDRRATMPNAKAIEAQIRSLGREAHFFNVNAADRDRRDEVIQASREALAGSPFRTLLHSLAFGTLKPYISEQEKQVIKPADMNMTLDVMAHSLVYWTQDLVRARLLRRGSKIFAMTSAGGNRVWLSYGAVSAAKAALEAHVRQLAVELAPEGISINALRAGVTDTPAARKIPGSDRMFQRALESNPAGRLTAPEDIAEVVVSMSRCQSNWITGNIIGVDGGEDLTT